MTRPTEHKMSGEQHICRVMSNPLPEAKRTSLWSSVAARVHVTSRQVVKKMLGETTGIWQLLVDTVTPGRESEEELQRYVNGNLDEIDDMFIPTVGLLTHQHERDQRDYGTAPSILFNSFHSSNA
jgi:hypothetical protein